MIKKLLPWVISLLYILSPIDLIPEYIVGPGFLDDLAVLGFVIWWATRGAKGFYAKEENFRHSSEKQESPNEEKDDPYEILGLKQNATKEEIRTAFKKLAAQYHPDKVQHLGKEFQELAHKKFVKIKKAYEILIE